MKNTNTMFAGIPSGKPSLRAAHELWLQSQTPRDNAVPETQGAEVDRNARIGIICGGMAGLYSGLVLQDFGFTNSTYGRQARRGSAVTCSRISNHPKLKIPIMRYYFLAILALLCNFQLSAQAVPKKAAKAAAAVLTYKTFADQKAAYGFHKAAAKTYKIRRLPPDSVSYGEPQEFLEKAAVPAAAGSAPFYSGAVKCSGNVFAGVDRAQAKTHKAAGALQSFATVNAFFSSGLLVNDAQMTNHDPAITESSESPRVNEELVNVTVATAYIYGIYREQDNDFHMIIGNGKTGAQMKIFNAEISGLPGNGGDAALAAVRDKIVKRFGDIGCTDGAFKPVSSFIPIKITGSIFFDIDHKAGVVGFGTYKPKTAWEIHPVTDIQFLDE